MRITGGNARGIILKTPNNMHTRPATDNLRQSIFSSLGQEILNTTILDLFAGTGAYGLEALSRGAKHVTFIEKHPAVVSILKSNAQAVCKSLNIPLSPSIITILKADVLNLTLPKNLKFDLIFADPPYEISPQILPQLLTIFTEYLAPKGKAIIELPASLQFPETSLIYLKKLGKSSGQGPSIHILQA